MEEMWGWGRRGEERREEGKSGEKGVESGMWTEEIGETEERKGEELGFGSCG